ncbi:MAG TPA: RagB/SusD family nutrient uptake outer membrane protein [Kofleriaceae bacterium]
MRFTQLITILACATLGACDLDVPDLNNPSLDDLQSHPTAPLVESACTGLLIGNRADIALEIGYVVQLGILGREAYNFDQADPRYITELLQSPLSAGSPFGGAFWLFPYANIRAGNLVLDAVDRVPEFADTDKAAIKGFAKTIMALDLLKVIVTHDTNGAVIDTDKPVDQLGAIVDKDAVYAKITSLLDDATTDLDGAGKAFPFALSSGFTGFDTPKTFRKFNRAIRARVAAYKKDYATVLTALGESFLDDTPMGKLDDGVYYSFSTKSGDLTNGLTNKNIYAHPSLVTDAEMNGSTPDLRLTAKVTMVTTAGAAQSLSSNYKFTMYPDPGSPVPLIRNEELILLEAEAKFFTGDVAGAVTALNVVRVTSGGLAPITGTPDATTFTDELLYERRYSLLFEGGHRWIDLRRFMRDLPLDMPSHVRNVRYPFPQAECNARPNEPKCMLGST